MSRTHYKVSKKLQEYRLRSHQVRQDPDGRKRWFYVTPREVCVVSNDVQGFTQLVTVPTLLLLRTLEKAGILDQLGYERRGSK